MNQKIVTAEFLLNGGSRPHDGRGGGGIRAPSVQKHCLKKLILGFLIQLRDRGVGDGDYCEKINKDVNQPCTYLGKRRKI